MGTSGSHFGDQLASHYEASAKPRIMPSSALNGHTPSHTFQPGEPGLHLAPPCVLLSVPFPQLLGHKGLLIISYHAWKSSAWPGDASGTVGRGHAMPTEKQAPPHRASERGHVRGKPQKGRPGSRTPPQPRGARRSAVLASSSPPCLVSKRPTPQHRRRASAVSAPRATG